MAALTSTSFKDAAGVVTTTVNTASASDTLSWVDGNNTTLILNNTTGGSLTAVIKGTAPSATYPVIGTSTTVDLSAGLSVVIAAGATKMLNLDKVKAYLAGTGVVTISGAATLSITVLN